MRWISTFPQQGDRQVRVGSEIGLLFIELATRRRLRVNGAVASLTREALTVAVNRAYPNCRMYIQRRTVSGGSVARTVPGAFGVAYNLVAAAREKGKILGQAARHAASRAGIAIGMLASLLVALMGNLEGIFELIRAHGGGSEALWQWLDVKNLRATPPSATWYPDDMWWWWRASRVIHDRDALGTVDLAQPQRRPDRDAIHGRVGADDADHAARSGPGRVAR